jgi:hypothetical protein
MPTSILTHPGSAHKDDFLACCLLASRYELPIVRREPTEEDLGGTDVIVVDVGHDHDPELLNFDHHQFPNDQVPTCSLSLVLHYFGLYDDARRFFSWLEPTEWFDCLGPRETAKRLNVSPEVVGRLLSPVDVSMLRRFSQSNELRPGEPVWEVMKMIGDDLLGYLTSLRTRIEFVRTHAEFWQLKAGRDTIEVLFMPRTDPMPMDPSAGLDRFIEASTGKRKVVGMVYPDRRSAGYGLSRYRDNRKLNFTRIEQELDVHFAHARGFVAKTSATCPDRLKELFAAAWTRQ